MKIKIKSVGVNVGSRTAARSVDLDHAQTILEYLGRGYRLTVSCEQTPMWTASYYPGKKGKLFVNRDADDETNNYFMRANRGTDDGRLYDDAPEWMSDLTRLLKSVTPPNTHWH